MAPLFAKQVSSKLAYGSARDVQRDLGENHQRSRGGFIHECACAKR